MEQLETVRAYLLIEHPGSWGEDALRDARLPDGLGAELRRRALEARIRVLLIRRTGRRPAGQSAGGGTTVFAAHAHPYRPWIERGTSFLEREDEVRRAKAKRKSGS